jgi:hypothetical protein
MEVFYLIYFLPVPAFQLVQTYTQLFSSPVADRMEDAGDLQPARRKQPSKAQILLKM